MPFELRKSNAVVGDADAEREPRLIAYRVSNGGQLHLKAAVRTRSWMDATWESFANRCLPLLVANQWGWFILSSQRVKAVWNGGPEIDATTVESDGGGPCQASTHFGHGILTWNLPWLFRTPRGINLLVRGPSNWPKDGACPLEGLVETDWSVATFTMNWQITRKDYPIIFEKGEPIAMLVPQRRGELEGLRPVECDISCDSFLAQAYGEWSKLRREFLQQLVIPGTDANKRRWQKDYMIGQLPDGVAATEHQVKINLQEFEAEKLARAKAAPRLSEPRHNQPTSPPIPFKMYGLHRTGTNLMTALMLRNFHVHFLEKGWEWKHGPVQDPDRDWNGIRPLLFLCVKNPYAWLHSFYNYCRRACGADPTVAIEFQRDPSVSFDEFVVTSIHGSKSPVHRWNELYRHWLTVLPQDRTTLVRQEDQLLDQIPLLETVEQRFGLVRRSEEITGIELKVDVNASVGGAFDHNYYVDHEYLYHYTPSLLETVNRELDWELMEHLGYLREPFALSERKIKGKTYTVRPCTSDAEVAKATTLDPYGFEQLRPRIASGGRIVDVGAHIGVTAMYAKQCWPDAQILAYEAWGQNHRLLRINARRMTRVTAVHAAVTDGTSASTSFAPPVLINERLHADSGQVNASGSEQVPAVGLKDAVERFGGATVDLLKIGCEASAGQVLFGAIASGAIKKFQHICSRIGSDVTIRRQLVEGLSPTHTVRFRSIDAGELLIAELKT